MKPCAKIPLSAQYPSLENAQAASSSLTLLRESIYNYFCKLQNKLLSQPIKLMEHISSGRPPTRLNTLLDKEKYR
jgi:hypothetical protein